MPRSTADSPTSAASRPGAERGAPRADRVSGPRDTPRRLQMRVGLKLMALAALLVATMTILAAFFSPPGSHIQLDREIDLAELAPGEIQLVAWGAREVLVQRRDPADLATLDAFDPRQLRDPDSRYSRQPAAARNPVRSIEPEFFVAFNDSTDLGCKLEFVTPDAAASEVRPWAGGFRDVCRGGRYDGAGRVLNGEPGLRNLEIPPHSLRLAPQPVLVLHSPR